MFSLTLYNEKLCLATSQVMDKGSACSVSLTSGVFSGACSAHLYCLSFCLACLIGISCCHSLKKQKKRLTTKYVILIDTSCSILIDHDIHSITESKDV